MAGLMLNDLVIGGKNIARCWSEAKKLVDDQGKLAGSAGPFAGNPETSGGALRPHATSSAQSWPNTPVSSEPGAKPRKADKTWHGYNSGSQPDTSPLLL